MDYDISVEEDIVIVREKSGKYEVDLRLRLFNFSKNTLIMLMTLPYKKEFDVFKSQLSVSNIYRC